MIYKMKTQKIVNLMYLQNLQQENGMLLMIKIL